MWSLDRSAALDTGLVEHVASLSAHLLRCCAEGEEAAELLRALTRPAAGPRLEAEVAALRFDCIAGRFDCPFDDDNEAISRVVRESHQNDPPELTAPELLTFANATLFHAALLRTLLRAGDEGEEGDDGRSCWRATLLAHDAFAERFDEVVYDYAVVCSLHVGYASVSVPTLRTSLAARRGRRAQSRPSKRSTSAVPVLRNDPRSETNAGRHPGRSGRSHARRAAAGGGGAPGAARGRARLLLGGGRACAGAQGARLPGPRRRPGAPARGDPGARAHRQRVLPHSAGISSARRD